MKKLILTLTIVLLSGMINYSQLNRERVVNLKDDTINFNRVEEVVIATAYCLKGSKMTNGLYPKEGYIAANTKQYRMHSKLSINNKVYIVGDTGSNITYGRIDIYLNSCRSAREFGRKKLKVKRI